VFRARYRANSSNRNNEMRRVCPLPGGQRVVGSNPAVPTIVGKSKKPAQHCVGFFVSACP